MFHGAAVLERHGIARAGRAALELAVEHQQTAGVARLGGCLGDQLVGKVVIEIIGAHGVAFRMRAAWPRPSSRVVEQPSMIAQLSGPYPWDATRLAFCAFRSSRRRRGRGRPRRREAATAVVLPIHTQFAGAPRGLGVPGAEIADHRGEAVCRRQFLQHVITGVE